MDAIRPTKEVFDKLIELEMVMIKEGVYVYDPVFENFVNNASKRGINRIRQMNIARKTTEMTPIITSYQCFRDQRNVKNLLASYVWFTIYMKEIKQKVPRHHSKHVYGLWYLNDHEPEVLDV